VNTLVGLDLAENPIPVSALHDECLDVGDFHMYLGALLLISRANNPVCPRRFGV
jgi:hypothetical protein